MPEFKFAKYLVAIVFLGLAASCNKSDDPASSEMDRTLLEYVPADTPYVMAALAQLPNDVLDIMEPKIDRFLQAYASIIRAVVADKVVHVGELGRSDEEVERFEAVVEEIAELMTLEGLRSAGIDRTSRSVFYGAGLLPVMRMQLTDGALMEAAISRIEEKAGKKMSVGKIGGYSYRYAGDDDAQIVVALIENDLIITLIPTDHSDALMKSVLGLTKPENSMADSGELQKIAADNGFKPYYLLLFDVTRLASTFLDDQSGSNKEILALIEYDTQALSDVCKTEIREMAAIAPRVIGGYSDVSTEKWSSNFIVEMRNDIAKGLSALVAPVQGLGSTDAGLFSFGMSLDLLAAREFYSARLDAMEADPFECESFAELQAGIQQGRDMLNQPVPPMVYGIKGFLAVVEALDGMDIARKQPPTSVEAGFLLAMDNPQSLLAMGAAFSPDLASLNLQPDGTPVELPLPPVSPALSEAFVAMTDSALVVSLGPDSESRIRKMLQGDFIEPSPFMSMFMDAGRYYGMIGDAMKLAQSEDGDENPELVAAMADIMTSMENWFSTVTFDINFTERGIEIPSTVELAEDE